MSIYVQKLKNINRKTLVIFQHHAKYTHVLYLQETTLLAAILASLNHWARLPGVIVPVFIEFTGDDGDDLISLKHCSINAELCINFTKD